MIETKYIILIGLILVGVFIYAFNLTRFTLFKINDAFKYINKYFWDSMFILNRFFNHPIIEALFYIIGIYVLFRLLYYMIGVI